MGFPPQSCEKAVAVAGGNLELAMEYILANSQQPEEFWATPAPGVPTGATEGRLVTGLSVQIQDGEGSDQFTVWKMEELLHLIETPLFESRWQ